MDNSFISDEIIEKVENDIKNHYGIAIDDIFRYAQALVQKKRLNEANNIINSFIREGDPKNKTQLAKLLLFAYRIPEAIELLNSKKYQSTYDLSILGRCFMKMGNLELADRIFDLALSNPDSNKIKRTVNTAQKLIYNNRVYGAFIETEYQSFVKNGGELEPGHVLNLRTEPEILAGDASSDPNFNMKSFAIWKIDGDDLYLIALTSNIRNNGYIIYKEDYPNIGKDRCIKDYLCKTTRDNILSVTDKLNQKDLRNIKYNLFITYYFNKNQTPEMIQYMKEVTFDIEQYNIVDYIDPYSKDRKAFFIKDIEDEHYVAYEINSITREILDFTPIMLHKDFLIFSVHRIYDDTIDNILSQIENNKTRKNIY